MADHNGALEMPVVSFVNLKGGVGKTALTVNLAYSLVEKHGMDVLLIDIDPQFNATQHLLDESVIVEDLSGKTIKDILDPVRPAIRVSKKKKKANRGASNSKRYIMSVETEEGEGSLSILPSLLDLSFVTRNPSGKEGRLETYLHSIDGEYDIVLIDCPPTISVLSMAAFNASRYYVIPVTPDYFAPIGIPLLEEEVRYFKDNLHAASGEMTPLGIVYTIVDNRWHANWESVQSRVEGATDIPSFDTHFTFSKYWRDCAADHEPVYRKKPNSPASKQLARFTSEFLATLKSHEAERTA